MKKRAKNPGTLLFCDIEDALTEEEDLFPADGETDDEKGASAPKTKKNGSKSGKAIPKAEKSPKWYLAAAFFLPLVIMYLIYIGMEVWPFGRNAVLVLDLNGQYVYYFEEFREIIHGNANLLYSWQRTLGGEFLGIFAYYLCSPFSLIVALLPAAVITESLLILILCKVGMCGMTMAYYLKRSRRVSDYTAILFGCMYALCAYGVIQAMNTMWIDAMYLLPIVLWGCERLIGENKPILYCLTLSLLFFTNYYIGYMVAIFLVLYFFYYALSTEDTRASSFVKAGLRFALYSLIAAAIAAVLLIPAYYGLTFGKTTFQSTNYDFLQRFDFLDFLTKLLPCSYDTVRPEGLPVVYSGLLTLLFVPLYFIAPMIPNRRKVWSGVIIVLLVMSMNASTVDIFWHGMSKPNWLNYRYSFILCFFLIAMAAEAFSRFDPIEYKETHKESGSPIPFRALLVVGLVLFGMIVMIQKQDYEYLDDMLCIWLSLAFLGAYLVALHPISCKKSRGTGKVFLLLLCCVELFASGLADLVALDSDVVFSDRQPYANFMARFRPIVAQIDDMDDGLYRMEKTVHRKVNDNMALGIRGISNSSSDLNASVIKLLGKMGYASRSHWTKYLGGTPVSDALLGIKYVIAEKEVDPLYREVASTDDLYAYENPYALDILYTVSDEILDYDLEETEQPMERLNEIVTAMLGEKDTVELFKPIDLDDTFYTNCDIGYTSGHRKFSPEVEGKTTSVTYMITAPTEDQIYVFFPSDWAREAELSLNGEDFGTYFGNETRRIVQLGAFREGEEVALELTLKKDDMYVASGVDYFYYMDTALYEEIMPRLLETSAEITAWSDTRIQAKAVNTADRDLLFTSIPYDEGWKVTVDGKEAPLVRTLDALLAIDLSAFPYGEHEIKMHYMPDCYIWGLCISAGGVVLLLFCILIRRLFKRVSKAEIESVSDDGTACVPLEELLAAVEAEAAQLPYPPVSSNAVPTEEEPFPFDEAPSLSAPDADANRAAPVLYEDAEEAPAPTASVSPEGEKKDAPAAPAPGDDSEDPTALLKELFPNDEV